MLVLSSCVPSQDIQTEIVICELKKVDTAYRFGENKLRLTWEAERITYTSFEPIGGVYMVGLRMPMMVRR